MESVYSGNLMRLYAVIFLQFVCDTALFLAVPLYSYSNGLSQLEIGLVGAVYSIIQIPLQPFFGRFSGVRIQRLLLITGIGGQFVLALLQHC